MRSGGCVWKIVFGVVGLCGIVPSHALADDCYMHRRAGVLLLGNSKIEFTIGAATGNILQIRNKTANADYLAKAPHGKFRMVYSTFALHGAVSGDPWSAAFGTLIDGGKQHVASTKFRQQDQGAVLEVTYKQLRLEKRTLDIAVSYTIEILTASEESRWQIKVENHEPGTIKEIQFPFFAGLASFPALAIPNHSGELLRDPIAKLSDEIPDVHIEYPARASMQWFDYYSPHAGLYLASYDRDLNYTQLHFGRSGNSPASVAMWITKYPFAITSSTWESPVATVGVHAGDWHWGGDTYRRWLESWVPAAQVSKRIAGMVESDTDIEFKGHAGNIEHTYDDAAQSALLRPTGTGQLFVGWFFDGHDSYFPEYSADPDMGGPEALTAAIDKIHNSGRLASAYVNLRLAAGKTPTYANDMGGGVLTKGPGIGVAKISSGELHEDWNEEWKLAEKGEGFHVVMCPSGKVWQDHMVAESERAIRDYHFDGIFLDQPGSFYSELCYNKHHGHSNPANAWGPGYFSTLQSIRERTRALDPDSYLWIEGMNDVYAQFLDFGLDKNAVWLPMRTHPEAESFPEMWRYTRPDSIIVDNPKAYSFPPSRDPVYGDAYNFVMGVRGYGLWDDIKNSTAEQMAARRPIVEKIIRLVRADSEELLHGEFRDNVGLTISPSSIFAKLYRTKKGLAVAIWNTSDAAATANIKVNLPSKDFATAAVKSLDSGEPILHTFRPGSMSLRVSLPAHGIDAITIHPDAVGRDGTSKK